jgi:hypothetical protein
MALRSRKRIPKRKAGEAETIDEAIDRGFANMSPMKVLPPEIRRRAAQATQQRKQVAVHTKRLILAQVRAERPSATPVGSTASMFAKGPSKAVLDRLR